MFVFGPGAFSLDALIDKYFDRAVPLPGVGGLRVDDAKSYTAVTFGDLCSARD